MTQTTAMKRILIVGSGGSGKSTLARQLGEILRIELIHLDTLYWQPGWVEPPKAEWESIIKELVQREAWIMDGNYGGTLDLRLPAADTVILLDLPRALCLWRAIWRRIRYHGRSRSDMAPGCPEKIDWPFIQWIWRYPMRSRPALLRKLETYEESKRIVRLRGPAQVRRFLVETGELAKRGKAVSSPHVG